MKVNEMGESIKENMEIHKYVSGIRTKRNATYVPGIIPESITIRMEYIEWPFVWIKMRIGE